jgi:cation transport regulator ChaC
MTAQPSNVELAWYFAYGSNMNDDIFRKRRSMAPMRSCVARLDDHELCFTIPVGPGERGVANIQQSPGKSVLGVAHLIPVADFERLDRSEGAPRSIYRRVRVQVSIEDLGFLEAETYQSDIKITGRKPSARYIGLMVRGAREHGLPAEYIDLLQSFELAADERKEFRVESTGSSFQTAKKNAQ